MNRNATMAVLWIPGPLPGMNEIIEAAKGSGGRGMGYARLKSQWTETIWALAKQARIDKPGPFDRRVLMVFDWIERDKRRDPDNIAAGGRKLILDSLVKAGVLKGDGWKCIDAWRDRWQVNADRPGVGVTIIVPAPTVLMGNDDPVVDEALAAVGITGERR